MDVIDSEISEALRQAGAEARASGVPRMQNPFLSSGQMPAATGETVEQWQRRHDLWLLGWNIEDMMLAN